MRSNARYNIDINTSEDLSIGDVAGASYSVDIQGTVKDTIKYLGCKTKLYYDFKNQGSERFMGTFTIEDVQFSNHSVSTIVAYDNIKKFDKPVYDYLSSEEMLAKYPITAKDLFALICDYCGVPYYADRKFLNCDLTVKGAFGDANLTARQVMSYIAQIAGGFIVCDLDGFAVVKNLMPNKATLEVNGNDYDNKSYTTPYTNLPYIIDTTAEEAGAHPYWKVLDKSKQTTQNLNEFPTEMLDTITYNSANGTVFYDYRLVMNALLDISDNPFVYNIEVDAESRAVLDSLIDQV